MELRLHPIPVEQMLTNNLKGKIMADPTPKYFESVPGILKGVYNAEKEKDRTWDNIVASKIQELTKLYKINDDKISNILYDWHRQVTIGYKHDKNFSPHINGFYMIFMVHGPWYEDYVKYVAADGPNNAGLSKIPSGAALSANFDDDREKVGNVHLNNPGSYFNMLATDIDVPDITEEYISVSSRLRNSFVPSRNYFVSDFSISYVENINLDIMRYHEGWHKYLNLVRRGEVNPYEGSSKACHEANNGYFVEVPYSNAVWVAVFRPFTTEIQLLIKLIGVMPVTMPLKQVIGNRSASKMTVLNISYKAADLFYKFYNSTNEFLEDKGNLAEAFRSEVLNTSTASASATNI